MENIKQKLKREHIYLVLILALFSLVLYLVFFTTGDDETVAKEEGQEYQTGVFDNEKPHEETPDTSVRIRSYAYVQAQDGIVELPLENASARPANMSVYIEGTQVFTSERALNPGEAVIAELTEEEIRELGGEGEEIPFTARIIPLDNENDEGTTGMGFGYRGTFLLN